MTSFAQSGGAVECSHSWKTCPIHSTGTEEMPPFWKVILCIYGDYETKDGSPVDESVAKDLSQRIAARLGGAPQSGRVDG